MISSKNVLQIKDLSFVVEFLEKHKFNAELLEDEEDYSLLIFRSPLCIEVIDGLNENCLQIIFGDTAASLIMHDGSVMHISFTLGWQSIEAVRNTQFSENEGSAVFLSSGTEKIHNLYFFLKALDMLLPILGSNGIKSIKDRAIFESLDPSTLVHPMPHEMRQRYLKCMANK
ncbi:hypothetical protein [Hydrogenophaga sp.]|uniref:hypothetical protein n=1 Tax=Hydrogenophaga sp. TaxID=1904254 RepID=UPI002FC72F67